MKTVRRTRAEVYKLWVDALRSGKYKQTKEALRYESGFCCLGVLCDLARKDGGPHWEDGEYGSAEYMDRNDFLSVPMARFMGLTIRKQKSLANMNDKGKSFSEIADRIEQIAEEQGL